MILACASLVFFVAFAHATYKDTDVIQNLPGLTYNINFKHYSGYLKASPGNNLHYWFVESQTSPANDPLLLWLNGGPGCSSLGGLLTEHGPFRPNPDGNTLFENIYSWNKKANVLYLEGPRNVGFSYQDYGVNNDTIYDDTRTAWDNFLALKDFLANYPEYSKRDFYVTGESYGGVYVPTLTRLLIQQIQAGNLTANLVGMAVGNGELSEYQQINSAVDYLYFHGMLGKDEWDALKSCCDNSTTLAYCNFTQWITIDSAGNAHGIGNSTCGQLVEQLGFLRVWVTINDVYNLYQDCYQQTLIGFKTKRRMRRSTNQSVRSPPPGFVDQGSLINWASTDAFGAFPCYMSSAAQIYLNLQTVRNALHIPASVTHWTDCNDDINNAYIQTHKDTTQVFDDMIASGYKLRILIYNGDADTACNFLGDEWFIEALKSKHNMAVTNHRRPWLFVEDPKYQFQIAGYRKSFSYQNITIDLVTVKGAGHFVPTDRPGPALQMITNFINNQANYSLPTGYSTTRAPLLPAYLPDPPTSCPSSSETFTFTSVANIIVASLFVIFSLSMK